MVRRWYPRISVSDSVCLFLSVCVGQAARSEDGVHKSLSPSLCLCLEQAARSEDSVHRSLSLWGKRQGQKTVFTDLCLSVWSKQHGQKTVFTDLSLCLQATWSEDGVHISLSLCGTSSKNRRRCPQLSLSSEVKGRTEAGHRTNVACKLYRPSGVSLTAGPDQLTRNNGPIILQPPFRQSKITSTSLSAPRRPCGDRCCHVGFAPAGSISGALTLQIFPGASRSIMMAGACLSFAAIASRYSAESDRGWLGHCPELILH